MEIDKQMRKQKKIDFQTEIKMELNGQIDDRSIDRKEVLGAHWFKIRI